MNGSEYRPIDRSIQFPGVVERAAERAARKREWKRSTACISGKRSSRKGKRGEREAAKLLGGTRVPMSGALDCLPNDIVLPNGWRGEVKLRASGLKVVYKGLASCDVLAFSDEGHPALFAMTMARFQVLLSNPLATGVAGSLRRKSGFISVRRWMAAEKADLVLFKADRQDWLVIMDQDHYTALTNLREAEA